MSALIELVDIYPTLATLAKSNPPANLSALDGTDFSALFDAEDPSSVQGKAYVDS